MTPVIELESVGRRFRCGPTTLTVLHDLSLRVAPGEFVALTGPSGSGKTTLLNLLGLLDRADEGVQRMDGRDLAGCSDDERTLMRNRRIGFVFQNPAMLPRLTARDNVAVPLLYRGVGVREARRRADRGLERLGLLASATQRIAELSGGQLQRVALARALIGQPRLILADEPTSALDAAAAAQAIATLLAACRETPAALVMISHQPADIVSADRRLALGGGRLHPLAETAAA